MFYGISGRQYMLASSSLKVGGEGSIYTISGDPSMLAKVYHPHILDNELEAKIKTMYQNPPAQEVLSQIAWPIDILYDEQRRFRGFMMRKLNVTHDLIDIYEYPPRALKSVTLQHKLIIAQNICLVISAVHKAGYIFGDFNPMNIGVNLNDGTVAFFDADTYHFKDKKTGLTYRCKAGCPGYVAPELLATCKKFTALHPEIKDVYAHAPLPTFTFETDNFALAIHIFKLIMNGFTPYNGIPETSSVSLASPGRGDIAVERNNYCFAPGKKPMAVATPAMASLPPEVQTLFERTFVEGFATPSARPTADEWEIALMHFGENLKQCSNNPYHQFYKELVSCPYCEADERYELEIHPAPKTSMTQKKFSTPPIVQTPQTPSKPINGQTQTASYISQRSGSHNSAKSSTANRGSMTLRTKIVITVVIVVISYMFISIMSNIDRDTVDIIPEDMSIEVGESVQLRISSTNSRLSASYTNAVIDIEWENDRHSGRNYYLTVTGVSEGTAFLTVYKRDNEDISDTITIEVVATQGDLSGDTDISSDINSGNINSNLEDVSEHTSKSSALPIELNSPIDDALESSDAPNWYAFSLTEQGYITIEFEHEQVSSSNTYWKLYLYRDDGSTFFDGGSRYWSVSGDQGLTTCSVGLPQGNFFIVVAPFSSSRWSDSDYTFSVAFYPTKDWEMELNNDKYGANDIVVNTAYHGAITNDGDQDWYLFNLQEDGFINISFDHGQVESPNTYWRLYLYRDDGSTYYDGGSRYWSVPGDEALITCDLGLPAGSYYLRVVPFSSSRWDSETYVFTVNYTESRTWEKELNNNQYNADKIDLGAYYSASISNDSDQDWYTFDLTSSGVLNISFMHTPLDSSNTYWRVYIYRDDGSTYYDGGARYWSIAGDEDLVTEEVGLPAGTYYLRVIPFSSSRWSSHTYSFSVNFTASNTWETEINNTKYDADTVSLGVSYSGAITNESDQDWYVFSIGTSHNVSITVNHIPIDSSNTYWRIYLYREDGSSSATEDAYWSIPGDENQTFSNIPLDPGTYYLRVTPFSSSRWSGQTYSFTIQ